MSAVPTIEPTTTKTVFHLRRVRFRSPIRLSTGRRSIEKRTTAETSSATAASIEDVKFSFASRVAPTTAQQILRNSRANVANEDTVYDAHCTALSDFKERI